MNTLSALIYALENPAEFDVVMRNGELTFTPIAKREDVLETAEIESPRYNRLPIRRLEIATEIAF